MCMIYDDWHFLLQIYIIGYQAYNLVMFYRIHQKKLTHYIVTFLKF
jgi:hypothetical protein